MLAETIDFMPLECIYLGWITALPWMGWEGVEIRVWECVSTDEESSRGVGFFS